MLSDAATEMKSSFNGLRAREVSLIFTAPTLADVRYRTGLSDLLELVRGRDDVNRLDCWLQGVVGGISVNDTEKQVAVDLFAFLASAAGSSSVQDASFVEGALVAARCGVLVLQPLEAAGAARQAEDWDRLASNALVPVVAYQRSWGEASARQDGRGLFFRAMGWSLLASSLALLCVLPWRLAAAAAAACGLVAAAFGGFVHTSGCGGNVASMFVLVASIAFTADRACLLCWAVPQLDVELTSGVADSIDPKLTTAAGRWGMRMSTAWAAVGYEVLMTSAAAVLFCIAVAVLGLSHGARIWGGLLAALLVLASSVVLAVLPATIALLGDLCQLPRQLAVRWRLLQALWQWAAQEARAEEQARDARATSAPSLDMRESKLGLLSDRVHQAVSTFCRLLGFSAGRNPCCFLFVACLTWALLIPGLYWVQGESDVLGTRLSTAFVDDFSDHGSDYWQDLVTASKSFPHQRSNVLTFKPKVADGLTSRSFMEAGYRLDARIKLLEATHNGRVYRFEDVCSRPRLGAPCDFLSLFSLLVPTPEALREVHSQIYANASAVLRFQRLLWKFGEPAALVQLPVLAVGGPSMGALNRTNLTAVSEWLVAQPVALGWMALKPGAASRAFEKRLRSLIELGTDHRTLEFRGSLELSMGDESAQLVSKRAWLFVVAFGAIAFYTLLFLARATRQPENSQISLILAGILIHCCGSAAAAGLHGYLGLRITFLGAMVPFVGLAAGVDGLFVMVSALRKADKTEHEVPRLLATVLTGNGPSIITSWWATCTALGAAAVISQRVPALLSFNLLLIFTLTFCHLGTLCVLPAMMALSERRILDGRIDLLPWRRWAAQDEDRDYEADDLELEDLEDVDVEDAVAPLRNVGPDSAGTLGSSGRQDSVQNSGSRPDSRDGQPPGSRDGQRPGSRDGPRPGSPPYWSSGGGALGRTISRSMTQTLSKGMIRSFSTVSESMKSAFSESDVIALTVSEVLTFEGLNENVRDTFIGSVAPLPAESRAFRIIGSLFYGALAIFGFGMLRDVRRGMEDVEFTRDGSDLRAYLDDVKADLQGQTLTELTMILHNPLVNDTGYQKGLLDLLEDLEKSTSVAATACWPRDLVVSGNLTAGPFAGDVAGLTRAFISNRSVAPGLPTLDDVAWAGDDIQAARCSLFVWQPLDPDARSSQASTLRGLVAASAVPATLTHESWAAHVSRHDAIARIAVHSTGAAVACIFIVLFLFLPVHIAVMAGLNIFLAVVVGVGLLSAAGFACDVVTYGATLVGMSFAVDFTSHFCLAVRYRVPRGASWAERMTFGLIECGVEVAHGCLAAILGVVILAGLGSDAMRTWAAVAAVICFFGGFFALVCFPAVVAFADDEGSLYNGKKDGPNAVTPFKGSMTGDLVVDCLGGKALYRGVKVLLKGEKQAREALENSGFTWDAYRPLFISKICTISDVSGNGDKGQCFKVGGCDYGWPISAIERIFDQEVSAELLITIIEAKGLRPAKVPASRKSDVYCTVKIFGKPETEFRTKVIDGTLEPKWNHEVFLGDFVNGDTLLFEVWDNGAWGWNRHLLGRAMLRSTAFYPGGWQTSWLQLDEDGGYGAQLNITITVASQERWAVPVDLLRTTGVPPAKKSEIIECLQAHEDTAGMWSKELVNLQTTALQEPNQFGLPGQIWNLDAAKASPKAILNEAPRPTLEEFVLDNRELQSSSKFMRLRRTKQELNFDPKVTAAWGQIVVGRDLGDGWFQDRATQLFLPMSIDGLQILFRKAACMELTLLPAEDEPDKVVEHSEETLRPADEEDEPRGPHGLTITDDARPADEKLEKDADVVGACGGAAIEAQGDSANKEVLEAFEAAPPPPLPLDAVGSRCRSVASPGLRDLVVFSGPLGCGPRPQTPAFATQEPAEAPAIARLVGLRSPDPPGLPRLGRPDDAALCSPSKGDSLISSERGPLPEGWVELFDDSMHQRYFVHKESCVSTWTRPGKRTLALEDETGTLPPGWRAEIDVALEKFYYIDMSTGNVTWKKPTDEDPDPGTSDLPEEWQQESDPTSGRVYYYNRLTMEAFWDEPV